MSIEFEVETLITAPAQTLFNAWLDSDQHTAMTGGEAHVSDEIGGAFTAWDGYISGSNLELSPPGRILQSWRTVEFSDDEADSVLEVLFEPAGDRTRVKIRHSNLPAHGMIYKEGWVENYFEPMKDFFE